MSIGLLVQEKQKIDFQDGCLGGHLRFPIGVILANFVLQVTQMLPTQLQVNWPFGSGEEAKNRFSTWPPRQPSWISDQNDFSYFFIYKSPRCFLPSFNSIGLLVQEKKRTLGFQDG